MTYGAPEQANFDWSGHKSGYRVHECLLDIIIIIMICTIIAVSMSHKINNYTATQLHLVFTPHNTHLSDIVTRTMIDVRHTDDAKYTLTQMVSIIVSSIRHCDSMIDVSHTDNVKYIPMHPDGVYYKYYSLIYQTL